MPLQYVIKHVYIAFTVAKAVTRQALKVQPNTVVKYLVRAQLATQQPHAASLIRLKQIS